MAQVTTGSQKRETIFLLGGSGFIGKNILQSVLTERYCILAPSSRELNLLDENMMDHFFEVNQIDYVIHAAMKPPHRFAKDLTQIFYANTRMFYNLARHAHRYKKLLYIGSGSVYDMRHYRPKVKEEEIGRTMPADELGFTKYVCNDFIQKSSNMVDLVVFSIFGKYEEYAIRFISNAICKVLHDLPITCHQNRRFDFLYVDDLIPIIDFFLSHESLHKAYNITPDRSIELLQVADMVRGIAGRPNHPIEVAKSGYALEYSGDNSRLRQEFTTLQLTPIEEAISRLYTWYKDHLHEINREYLLYDP